MNIKKVKEWAKAHEVTLMMIGSAITGAAGFYICNRFVFSKPSVSNSNYGVDLDISLLNDSKIAIGMHECLKNGNYGVGVTGSFSAKDVINIAEGLITVASNVLNESITIEANHSQK